MRNYQEHNAKDIRDLTIYTKTIPAHPASFADFPSVLHPDIRTYLTSHNIPRLYTHQAEMFEKAQSGENVVITTSTASGKTLDAEFPASGAAGGSGQSAHQSNICIPDESACGGSVQGASANS